MDRLVSEDESGDGGLRIASADCIHKTRDRLRQPRRGAIQKPTYRQKASIASLSRDPARGQKWAIALTLARGGAYRARRVAGGKERGHAMRGVWGAESGRTGLVRSLRRSPARAKLAATRALDARRFLPARLFCIRLARVELCFAGHFRQPCLLVVPLRLAPFLQLRFTVVWITVVCITVGSIRLRVRAVSPRRVGGRAGPIPYGEQLGAGVVGTVAAAS